jgi:hypothetical protein
MDSHYSYTFSENSALFLELDMAHQVFLVLLHQSGLVCGLWNLGPTIHELAQTNFYYILFCH